jgi:hypothetical protein
VKGSLDNQTKNVFIWKIKMIQVVVVAEVLVVAELQQVAAKKTDGATWPRHSTTMVS